MAYQIFAKVKHPTYIFHIKKIFIKLYHSVDTNFAKLFIDSSNGNGTVALENTSNRTTTNQTDDAIATTSNPSVTTVGNGT